MSAGCQIMRQVWTMRPCILCHVTIALSLLRPCWDGGWAWVALCLLGVACRGLELSETNGWAGHYKYTVQGSHRHTHCHHDSSHTPLHIQTPRTHQGCTLGRCKNWLQHWLWIVIAASASMVTSKNTNMNSGRNSGTDFTNLWITTAMRLCRKCQCQTSCHVPGLSELTDNPQWKPRQIAAVVFWQARGPFWHK